MPPKTTKKKTPAGNAQGVAVKIPRPAYRIAQRIARREQRTITTTIERALVAYEGRLEK